MHMWPWRDWCKLISIIQLKLWAYEKNRAYFYILWFFANTQNEKHWLQNLFYCLSILTRKSISEIFCWILTSKIVSENLKITIFKALSPYHFIENQNYLHDIQISAQKSLYGHVCSQKLYNPFHSTVNNHKWGIALIHATTETGVTCRQS